MAVASGTLEAGSASDGSAAEQKQAMDVSSVQIMQAGQHEVGLPVPVPASEVLDEMVVVLDGLRSQGTVRPARRTRLCARNITDTETTAIRHISFA